MKHFNKFYIKKSHFDLNSGILELNYSFDDDIFFKEIINFKDENFEILPTLDKDIIQNIVLNISIALGTSYYKAYPTRDIVIQDGYLDDYQKDFWTRFYKFGMGEFLYKNQIDPTGLFNFITTGSNNSKQLDLTWELQPRAIVPIGGGKDSCLTIEKINNAGVDFDLFTFSSKDNNIFKDITNVVSKKRLFVKRQLSPELFKLNELGYYNGHVPITGQMSFILVLVAYLYGYKYIVWSNEYSANYGNLLYKGIEINHQYSKSIYFENDMRDYIKRYFSTDLEYFSILRGYYEARIVKEFAQFEKYFPYFTSCNKNFKVIKKSINERWCLDCPKCGFVFACLHPYLDNKNLLKIFGKNMYEDHEQETLFRELLGISGHKPFECVGTNEEVIFSMWKSYNNEEDKTKLPFILKLFEREVLPKMTDNDFYELGQKMFKNYENNIPDVFLD